ncbi:MAG: PIN domain-containing protein [Chloroflexota bacterium]
MSSSPLRAVLDANVLYPFSLRDTLLRIAAADYIQIYWSAQILEETSRNLVSKAGITQAQADYLLNAMRRAFPDAMVTGHEPLIETMPNDEKDRHVAAAAVKVSAHVIVTNNLRDFRGLPDGVEAQSPDQFLLALFTSEPDGLIRVLKQQAAALQRPPVTLEELLVGLSKTVPEFAQAIQSQL